MSAAPHTLPAGAAARDGADRAAQAPSLAAVAARCARVLRERGWLVALCLALVLAATLAYLRIAPRTYVAQAQLLVQPAGPNDTLLATLPVLHRSAAPALDLQAATSLILSRAVARRAVYALHLRISPATALGYVSATVGQSDLLALRASSGSPRFSQRLANAFATAAVANATASMHAAIRAELPGLERALAKTPVAARYLPAGPGTDLDQLRVLLGEPNPTITLAARATVPTAPTKPREHSALIMALVAGLLIGVAAAFGADALDPRLRREEQLRELLAVPVLARVPRERARRALPLVRGQRELPLVPGQMSRAFREAHRALRSRLLARAQAQGGGRVCLICGTQPGEGKSTTAIGLACELARAGASVILLECDLRRPTFARALGIEHFASVGQVLAGSVDLPAALVRVSPDDRELAVLAARLSATVPAPRMTQSRLRQLIAQARDSADFVVVDSPPLDAVADALQLARFADEILLVARIGRSRLDRLRDAAVRIRHSGAAVTGLVVIGAPRQPSSYRAYLEEEGTARQGEGTARQGEGTASSAGARC
jgi:Mrp family chromosome partitioning ATPase/LPS O-antigen subunit length determinant protein (WzzB/FepE family)